MYRILSGGPYSDQRREKESNRIKFHNINTWQGFESLLV